MLQQLKQSEAEKLIEMLKRSLTDNVIFPERGKSLDFNVEGESKHDLFKIHIYRGKINRLKYNIGALIEKNGTPLLELHINPSNKHMNPDGTVISCSHWHIYNEIYGIKIAFPAENIQSDDFVKTTIEFLDKFNVIEKPEIQYQCELL